MLGSLCCHTPLTSFPCQGDESSREVTKDLGSELRIRDSEQGKLLSIPPVPAPARAACLNFLHQ